MAREVFWRSGSRVEGGFGGSPPILGRLVFWRSGSRVKGGVWGGHPPHSRALDPPPSCEGAVQARRAGKGHSHAVVVVCPLREQLV